MKRLLAQIGLTYLSVLAVVFYLSKLWTLMLGAVFLVIAIIFLVAKKYRKTIYLPVMAIVAVIACVVNLSYTAFVYDDIVERYSEYDGEISAVLIDEPYKVNDSYVYEFNCIKVNGEEADFKFTATHRDLLDIDEFDEIKTEAFLLETKSNSHIAKGYYITAYFSYDYPELEVTKTEDKPLCYYAIQLRKSIRNILKRNLSTDAFSLCSALLIGDKYALSDEIVSNFREAGVAHIIVVSGMHFSIIASIGLLFYRKWWRTKYVVTALLCVFIFVYIGITGATPPVVRSGVMMLVNIIGIAISRDSYSPNSLGLAALVVVLSNGSPYIAGDIGLILSFATTFSILCLAPEFKSKFPKRIKRPFETVKHNKKPVEFFRKLVNKTANIFISALCVNIAAYLVVLPLSLFIFHSTSTLSVITGFLLFIPVYVLMLLAIALVIFGCIPFLSFLMPILTISVEMVSDIIFGIVKFFSELPFSYLQVTNTFVCIWVLFYFYVFASLFLIRNKHRLSLFVLVVTLVFSAGYISSTIASMSVCSINIYDAYGGETVVYSSYDTNAVLSIDCNDRYSDYVVSKIAKDVSSVDFASSVVDTKSASNSMKKLCEAFAIKDILLYDTKRTVTFDDSVNVVCSPQFTDVVELADGSRACYILAEDVYVTYFRYADKSLLIIPRGVDAEFIPESYRNADTIVVCDCPENYELLACETLVVSENSDVSYNIMKLMYPISERVMLTCEGDIKLLTEV